MRPYMLFNGPGNVLAMNYVATRFWAKVDKHREDGCWLWTAGTVRRGYGFFRVSRTQSMHAHRWAYQDAFGSLPSSIRVDHKFHCNPLCVNPSHLRAITHKQNLENRRGAQSDSRSGVRGVYWHKGAKRWYAQVRHFQKKIHVGSFVTLAEAEAAVIAKRAELFTHSDGR